MKSMILGLGAAGAKATINLVEKGIVGPNDFRLINSTLKDVPEKYKQSAIRLTDSDAGAAQERDRGKKMAYEAIKSDKLKLENICDPDHEKVILITSLCGGTGSGSSVVIAQYFKDVLGKPVEIFGFVGFPDESPRALRNITEFCQDLDNGYIIQLIRNDAFLKEARGNRQKAEQLANDEVARRICVCNGSMIVEGSQNIDDVDLYKLETTTGYKSVEFIPVNDKIKSQDQFNDIIKDGLDETKSVESDAGGMTRLGVIANIMPSSQQFIDGSYKGVRDRLGAPYEIFQHIEYVDTQQEFIALIAVGMKMPFEAVKKIYEEYVREAERVDTTKDDFFEKVNSFRGDISANAFDMAERTPGSRNAFFASFEQKEAEKNAPKMTKEEFMAKNF